MTRLVIVTVLLAVVAGVVFWRGRGAGPQRTVKVTARAGLARGSAVAVVEVDGRRFLLGAAGNTVNVLAELDAAPADEPVSTAATAVDIATPASPKVSNVSNVAPAGGPFDRLKSMTVRTPVPTRRSLRSPS
jgi:flagellar biogenesis protein FliO